MLVTVTFLLPLHTNLLSQAGIMHYSYIASFASPDPTTPSATNRRVGLVWLARLIGQLHMQDRSRRSTQTANGKDKNPSAQTLGS